jgi:threonine dehydratase
VGATFVHPFEDPVVIAGQGTIGLELADQVEQIETVVIPIGGGGLASGIALALRAVKPGLRIVGVQAEGTLPGGSGYTIADGIAVKKPGELTMSILDDVLDEIVSVGDEEISDALVVLLERTKLVVEGAGAISVAALLAGKVGGSGCVVPVLSGGNIDATLLISVMRHGLAVAGRFLVLRTRVPDRPGELARLLTLLAEERVNVVEVEHQREGAGLPVAETGVELTLLTRDPAHCDEIVETMQRLGYSAERLT